MCGHIQLSGAQIWPVFCPIYRCELADRLLNQLQTTGNQISERFIEGNSLLSCSADMRG